MKKIMFVDAETDGLYGQILAIGAVVIDETDCECASFYRKQKIAMAQMKDEWAKEYVYPLLGEGQECDSEETLLEVFWEFYMEHQECLVIADVPYPIEFSMFYKCVVKEEENRKWKAPYPLMDLSSMLFAKGIDPLKDRIELVKKSVQQHNALEDARMSAAIYREYIK